MEKKLTKKVVVIGFQPYNERMYPYLYDFITLIKDRCDLTYFDGDNRGANVYKTRYGRRDLLKPVTIYMYYKRLFRERRAVKDAKRRIGELLSGDVDVVIAIDHTALNHAGSFKKNKTKLVFWSHDIITPDHLWFVYRGARRFIKENRESIKRCDLMIIQDSKRGAVLDSVIMSHDIPRFYLPVSVRGDENSREVALKKSTGISSDRIVLMQLGAINRFRSSHLLIEELQHLRKGISLVFQGGIDGDILELAERSGRKPEINRHAEDFKEMRRRIGSADIGIVTIKKLNLNNYFYSKASGQLVEFFRLGIPVIIIDSEEIGEFVAGNNCGLHMDSISELGETIEKIVDNYGEYSTNCRRTFESTFDIEQYTDRLFDEILR